MNKKEIKRIHCNTALVFFVKEDDIKQEGGLLTLSNAVAFDEVSYSGEYILNRLEENENHNEYLKPIIYRIENGGGSCFSIPVSTVRIITSDTVSDADDSWYKFDNQGKPYGMPF